MYERETDGRREVAITDIEALVPKNHLVRKIEKVMDYEWTSILSAAHCKTSNVVLLFYTTSEVYTIFGMVSGHA